MAVVAARTEGTRRSSSAYCLELGILNNMPDAALEHTEQQFFALLSAAASDLLVRVRFFSLSSMQRDVPGRAHLARNAYLAAADLARSNLDALIVTGTEPRAPDLRLEPFWSELAEVFDWVAQEGPSTVFSCLAAHAAVLHYDGIARKRLAQKRFGVFDHLVAQSDALPKDLPAQFHIAHSRWNELAETDLARCGYRTLTWSAEAGVELFIRRGRNDLLFCQGHPEYGNATLTREYRRDVKRWLTGESNAYPLLPKRYFSPADIMALDRFRARAAFARSEALMAEFPALERKDDARWNAPGAAVFSAWLRAIVEKKRTERPLRPASVAPRVAIEAA